MATPDRLRLAAVAAARSTCLAAAAARAPLAISCWAGDMARLVASVMWSTRLSVRDTRTASSAAAARARSIAPWGRAAPGDDSFAGTCSRPSFRRISIRCVACMPSAPCSPRSRACAGVCALLGADFTRRARRCASPATPPGLPLASRCSATSSVAAATPAVHCEGRVCASAATASTTSL